MEQLTIKVPGAPVSEVQLAPGVYTIGRANEANLQIDHPSVSGAHCEITVGERAVAVKDLGSTNGIMLDGQRVEEAQIGPGQSFRLGDVEVRLGKPPVKLALDAGDRSGVPQTTVYQPPPPPPPAKARPKSFYKSIPGAFIYPLRKNGFFLLIAGTVIFGIFDFIITLRVGGLVLLGASVAAFVAAVITGYLFEYMQTIIASSANGERNIPNWPDYESLWESIFLPYLRLLGIAGACLAPAMLWAMAFGAAGRWMIMPLLIAGCLYGPMALLAVVMDDSLLAVNPLLVIPTIARVPAQYLVICVLFGGLFFLIGEAGALASLKLPVLARQMATVFFSLYFSIVQVRLLGLLYHCEKERFRWRD